MKKFSKEEFPSIGGIICSKMVVEEKYKPNFMFREKPRDKNDSGWVVFSGFESDEYSENADNFGVYSAKTLLELDESIAEILLYKGIGSVWEKNQTGVWGEVFDYPLEDDFMIEEKLTEDWSFSINHLFLKIKEEDCLFFTTNDKSIRFSIWDYTGKSKKEIAEEKIAEINEKDCIKQYKISEENLIKVGYHIKEYDEEKDYEYNLLCAFSITEEEVLFHCFYFDNDRDLQWALDTWKSIHYGK